MLTRRLRAVALAGPALALLLAGLGCGETVRSRAHPALGDAERRPRTVAVVPLRLAGELARKGGPESAEAGAAAFVATKLADALAERGVEVVRPERVARALGIEAVARDRIDPAAAAARATERFGADGILLGALWRYDERSGQAAGSLHPASVGFEVTLHAAPGGEALWSAIFDETQQALTDNLFNATRYPGRGMRWLTAEQLATWGADEVASAAPVGP